MSKNKKIFSDRSSGTVSKKTFVDFIQLLSMILIVLSHSVPEDMSSSVPQFLTTMIPYLQKVGLAIFMWASAWLTVYTKALDKYGYLGYIKKRAIRLLVPYFLMNILMIVPKWLLAKYSNAEMGLNPLLIVYQLIAPREGVLPHLWFLPTLFILSLGLPLFSFCHKNIDYSIGIMGLGIVFLYMPTITNVLCVDDFFGYFFWYNLGIFFAIHDKIALKHIPLIIGGCVALIFCMVFEMLGFSKTYWFLYTLSLVSIIVGLGLIFEETGISLSKIKKYTFPIYIMSLPIQNVINIICIKIDMDIYFSFIVLFILGIAIPFGISILVDLIEKRSKWKVLSKIIGM